MLKIFIILVIILVLLAIFIVQILPYEKKNSENKASKYNNTVKKDENVAKINKKLPSGDKVVKQCSDDINKTCLFEQQSAEPAQNTKVDVESQKVGFNKTSSIEELLPEMAEFPQKQIKNITTQLKDTICKEPENTMTSNFDS